MQKRLIYVLMVVNLRDGCMKCLVSFDNTTLPNSENETLACLRGGGSKILKGDSIVQQIYHTPPIASRFLSSDLAVGAA